MKKTFTIYAFLFIVFVSSSRAQDVNFGSPYNRVMWPLSSGVQGGIMGNDLNYSRLTLFHGHSISLQTGSNGPDVAKTRLYVNSSGQVGIGTMGPDTPLQVESTSSGYDVNNMLVGGAILHVRQSGNNVGNSLGLLRLTSFNGSGAIGVTYNRTYNSDMVFGVNNDSPNVIERMRIKANGNILIGKDSQTNSSYKLDVSGDIRANKIVVNTDGADFVFEKNYSLKPLSEVEQFIKAKQHLPEVPSAADMQANGVNLGELNTKLLQKIEELTLYIIEQNKRIEALETKN